MAVTAANLWPFFGTDWYKKKWRKHCILSEFTDNFMVRATKQPQKKLNFYFRSQIVSDFLSEQLLTWWNLNFSDWVSLKISTEHLDSELLVNICIILYCIHFFKVFIALSFGFYENIEKHA